ANPAEMAQRKKAAHLAEIYRPIIDRFKSKQWVFHPRALELPEMTDGNIFRLADGSVMVTMVSIWRDLYNLPGAAPGVELACRLPDAGEFTRFSLIQPDLNDSSEGKPIVPVERAGDRIRFKLEKHEMASVVLLEK
ncbi:MAG TPA: hypothetical protein VJ417_10645, partial [Candidatus Glassbacteria bacterium]|nr:hypothetical protein [Candidatus Glassbacteria bacterium]